MSRRDLNSTGTKLQVNIAVSNDRDLTVSQRQLQHFADQMPITRIFRIYRNGSIAQHRLRTGSGNSQIGISFTHNRITDIPQIAGIIFMFHLNIT